MNLLPEALKDAPASSLIGVECLVWTEYVREEATLKSLVFPRFAATAEVGWCGQGRPGYGDFAKRMEMLFGIFEENGIHATTLDGWIPSEQRNEKAAC